MASLLGLVVLMTGGLLCSLAAWASWLEWHSRKLEIEIARADRQTREAEKQGRIAEDRRRLAERHSFAEGLRMARQAIDAHQIEMAQEILHDIRSGLDGFDPPGFVWHYLWRQSNRDFSQLWGHDSSINYSVLSPSGTMLAAVDSQGKTLLWDIAPNGCAQRPRAIQAPRIANSEHISFSPDSRILVTLSRDRSSEGLNVFESAPGRQVTRLDCGPCEWIGKIRSDNESGRVAVLVARADGKRRILWWNIADGHREPHSWPIADGTTFCEISAAGPAVVATRNGRSQLLDLWTGLSQVELAGPDLTGNQLFAFSSDGHVFAAHARNNLVTFWDANSGREVAACDALARAKEPVLSRTGSRLAMIDDRGRLIVFDRLTNRSQVLTAGSGRTLRALSMSFSSDENLLAVSIATAPGGPQPPEVWDVATPFGFICFQAARTSRISLSSPDLDRWCSRAVPDRESGGLILRLKLPRSQAIRTRPGHWRSRRMVRRLLQAVMIPTRVRPSNSGMSPPADSSTAGRGTRPRSRR